MKDILQALNDAIRGRGSIVVTRDGMLVACAVGEGLHLERMSALGASIVTEIGSALEAAGLQGFAQMEIATEQGKVVLVEAGPTFLLVLLGARREVGPGSIEIRTAAERVARAATLALSESS